MIIAWTIFLLGLFFTLIAILALKNCLTSKICKTWDYRGFVVSIIVSSCAAQYIWG